jgi:hypothetical protein
MIPSALGLQAMGGFFRNPFRCCRPDCVTVKDSNKEDYENGINKKETNRQLIHEFNKKPKLDPTTGVIKI